MNKHAYHAPPLFALLPTLLGFATSASAATVDQSYQSPTVNGYPIGTIYPVYGSTAADTARRFCTDRNYTGGNPIYTSTRATTYSYVDGTNGNGSWLTNWSSSATTIDTVSCYYAYSTGNENATGVVYPTPKINGYPVGTIYPRYGSSPGDTANRFCRDQGYIGALYYPTSLKATAYSYINGTNGNGSWSTSGDSRVIVIETITCGNYLPTADLTAGSNHSCALTSTNGVKCWGYNAYGEVGDGSYTNRTTPVDVVGLSSGVAALSGGYWHTCAIIGGGVRCWGINGYGQLGDGTTTQRPTPVGVVGLSTSVGALALGDAFSCALTSLGGVKCWGFNGYGGLGDGTTTQRTTPVDVVGLGSGVKAIAAGGGFACALTFVGGVKCWGFNGYGGLGDGTTTQRTTPVDVVGLGSGVVAISAGDAFACALTSSGGVKCWGGNFYGEVGDGTTTQRTTPVDVVGLSAGVTAITTGNVSACALTSSGGVKCWGYNVWGNLGDGTTTNRSTPVNVVGLSSGVSALGEANGAHTCASMSLGGVKCWGYNAYGDLGNGSTSSTLTPVSVVGF